MALLASQPPRKAAEAVQTTFQALADNAMFRTPAMRNAAGPLHLAEPHQVFTLGLADLVAGRGLDAAKATGWRYLVQEGDNAVASAEAVATGAGDDHAFSSFDEGRFVASTADAIRTARALPEVSDHGFELRLLHVPGLNVMALWLHEAEGARDLLVPLAPSPLDTPTGRAVPAALLLEELAAKAPALAGIGPDDTSGS